MTATSPIEVVTAFGAAWAAHDLDAALALIADDCVFDATGPAPDGRRHVGSEAIRKAWQAIFDDVSSASTQKRPSRPVTGSSSGGATAGTAATCAASTSSGCATARSPKSCRT